MDFRDIIKDTIKLCRITNNSVMNKLKIADKRKIKLERRMKRNGGWTKDGRFKHMRWSDLRTTVKWISNHTGRGTGMGFTGTQVDYLKHVYKITYGEDYDIEVPKRFRTATTFTQEPCDQCKKLEQTNPGNDDILTTRTNPWKEQYYHIMQAVVADGYKAFCGLKWFDKQVDKIKDTLTGNTPAGKPWRNAYLHWKIGVGSSQVLFYNGRECFFKTDVSAFNQFQNVKKGNRENTWLDIAEKYINLGEETLQCVGGLYVLDESKLCEKCKPNVEPDPLIYG